MSKKNGITTKTEIQDFQFPQEGNKQTFAEFIHNSKEGTYFGRTPKNWGQLLAFYAVFYILLAALFAICMKGLLSTLKDNEPKWKLDRSLIGTNPGLGYRPLGGEVMRGSVIQFDTKKPEESLYWKELMDEFFAPYNHTGRLDKICYFNQTHKDSDVCLVDIASFGPCSGDYNYGYNNARPCVFLKLNKIFGWKPEFYDNLKELPEDMPQDLKDHIEQTPELERQQIWVSCKGQHSADMETVGDIKFYPRQGFPAYYYPYLNQDGYLSPVIAVQFEKLKINTLINVECRAWAKNILYGINPNRGRTGSVTFQLFLD